MFFKGAIKLDMVLHLLPFILMWTQENRIACHCLHTFGEHWTMNLPSEMAFYTLKNDLKVTDWPLNTRQLIIIIRYCILIFWIRACISYPIAHSVQVGSDFQNLLWPQYGESRMLIFWQLRELVRWRVLWNCGMYIWAGSSLHFLTDEAN